jgi:hypothetical protein
MGLAEEQKLGKGGTSTTENAENTKIFDHGLHGWARMGRAEKQKLRNQKLGNGKGGLRTTGLEEKWKLGKGGVNHRERRERKDFLTTDYPERQGRNQRPDIAAINLSFLWLPRLAFGCGLADCFFARRGITGQVEILV